VRNNPWGPAYDTHNDNEIKKEPWPCRTQARLLVFAQQRRGAAAIDSLESSECSRAAVLPLPLEKYSYYTPKV
jgi:hypothetical protein